MSDIVLGSVKVSEAYADLEAENARLRGVVDRMRPILGEAVDAIEAAFAVLEDSDAS